MSIHPARALAILLRSLRLRNRSFSIISNTCIGGVIANAVGQEQRSPTVNLVLYEEDFLTFCANLPAYSRCPMEAAAAPEELEAQLAAGYPLGFLRGGSEGLPDLTVRFVHYHSFDEARDAWIRRFRRVNYDNIFLVMDRGMDAREEILDRFHALPYAHKVFFTHREDPVRWPDTFRLSYYTERDFRPAHMYTFVRRGLLQYRILDEFDYVHWLNTGVIRRSPLFGSGEHNRS